MLQSSQELAASVVESKDKTQLPRAASVLSGRGQTNYSCSYLGLAPSLCCVFAPPIDWVVLNQPLISLQMGMFRSHDGDYFIEPLLSVDEQEDEEEQNKPHIIYRRSAPPREPSTGRRACDTSGICFLIKYRCCVEMGSLPHFKNAAAFLLFAEHRRIRHGLVNPLVR